MPKEKKSTKLCAHCGKPGATTRDDVIPATLFLGARPVNNIRVPSHRGCNESLQQDEHYFRFFVLLGGSYHNPQARQLWEEGMRPYLRRSRAFSARLFRSIERQEIRSDGGVILGTADVFHPEDERINRVLMKISRGLYYNEEHSPLGNAEFFIRSFRQVDAIPSEVRELALACPVVAMGENIRFRYGRSAENNRWTLTLFQCYSSPVFLVMTSTADHNSTLSA